MILRLLNGQGIAGLAASLALALLLIVQRGETRHWRKQSDQFRVLYQPRRRAFAGTVAYVRAAADTARPPTAPMPHGSPPPSKQSTKGPTMSSKLALPMLALALSAARRPQAAQPITAVAEQRHCPAYPLPPADLLKPPVKTDFLPPTP